MDIVTRKQMLDLQTPEWWETQAHSLMSLAAEASADVRASRMTSFMAAYLRQDSRLSPGTLALLLGYLANVVLEAGTSGVPDLGPEQLSEIVRGASADAPEAVSELYLAVASLLFAQNRTDGVRLEIIDEAARVVSVGSEQWVKAIMAKVFHFIDVADYRAGMRLLDEIERLPVSSSAGDLLAIGVSAHRGVLLAASAGDFDLAMKHLSDAVEAFDESQHQALAFRWVSTAIHYQGRLFEQQGDLGSAISKYIEAEQFRVRAQSTVSVDPTAEGFYHLRLAETLLAGQNPVLALEHLTRAATILDRSKNTGSAWQQCLLARAAYVVYVDGRDGVPSALSYANEAYADSRANEFVRGQLLVVAFVASLVVRFRTVRAFPTLVRWGVSTVTTLSPRDAAALIRAVRRLNRLARNRRGLRSEKTSVVDCPCGEHQ